MPYPYVHEALRDLRSEAAPDLPVVGIALL